MTAFRRLAPLVLWGVVGLACLVTAMVIMAEPPASHEHEAQDMNPATLAVIVVGAIGLVGNLGGFTLIKWSVERIVEERATKTENAFRENIKTEVDRRDVKLADLDAHYDGKVALCFKRIDELRGEYVVLRTQHDMMHGHATDPARPVNRPVCIGPRPGPADPEVEGFR